MGDIDELMKAKIGGKYTLMAGKKIGIGSFGTVYIGVDQNTDEVVAIKIEDAKILHPILPYEAKIMQRLQGKNGIPKLYFSGEVAGFNVMATDMLGPSLEDLFNLCDRKFSLKTVLLIADQLISRIETFHHKGFVHRDIKPENCLIGLAKKSNTFHLIDYGLAKKFRDLKTHQHIPYKENKGLVGTARYASLNSHLGMELSRRDDLETLGYMFVYFLKGYLPWQGIKISDRQEKFNKIMEKKLITPPEIFCKGLPIEFSIYFNYLKSLKFEEKPDYSYLRKMFLKLFVSKKFKLDYIYDWCINPHDVDGGENNPIRVYQKNNDTDNPLKIMIDTTIPQKPLSQQEQDEINYGLENQQYQQDDMLQSQYNQEKDYNDDQNLTPGQQILDQNEEYEKNSNQIQSQQQQQDSLEKKDQIQNLEENNEPDKSIFE
ncbi:Protein kinase-like domain [Pseudocohnilembus persalinus]|uniref:Casein kinase I n=1 Tax=Pseudocohnilembus persalinus TaxID=266149 RepID=A0A0V0Q807_PSEPJ|nr:Protein kinase-like domain [Pseudocohnilembus persalinus]|eukprot:KRW98299.1 Protein kinase-like domain [Pseudocohnilembus persalinus]